ncbi:hypothetical protein ZWY2020_046874 [Hordeum vulgare]|nr:hypothetical protein ZWY2020_046874 [Hordeum vulgare]
MAASTSSHAARGLPHDPTHPAATAQRGAILLPPLPSAGSGPGSDSRKVEALRLRRRLNRPVPVFPAPRSAARSAAASSPCMDSDLLLVRWTDIGEKKQELVPNIEKDHAKKVRMAENSSRIQELVPNVKKDRSSHRRSIAELWRRTEISKRVRNLQELIPNMEKMENTVLFFAELALLQYGLVQSKPSTQIHRKSNRSGIQSFV